MGTLNNADLNLIVGLDFSKSIAQDAPRAAAQIEKIFNNGAKFRNLVEPLGKISSSANEFAKSLEAANARVIAFGASVGVVYNIQKVFEKLVESTISVEKALVDIQTISNQSSKEIAKFGSELFKIGNQTGQTFAEVSKAALEFSRQGLAVSETLKRTKDALILTRISGLDAKDAVETLTAAVNSFGDGLLTTTQLVNKFVAVDTSFAVSSKDLAEAISRVGATASDSSVSLDQLLGVVTAVQQSTARGGAVIGNAFKTIFTRLQRSDTIEQLRELGVEINNTQTGIEKLKAISAAVKGADVTTAARIKELSAGVFQVNILSAALEDLGKSYGVYESAQRTSAGATDEATRNNEKLNKSLASLLIQTQNNITETFANIGKQSINSPFKTLLGYFNSFLGDVNETSGSDLGKGLLNGFAKFIEGPGIAIVSNVVGRLLLSFVSFSKEAFKQLTTLSAIGQQRAAAEKAVVSILSQEPEILNSILKGEMRIDEVQAKIISNLRLRLMLQEKLASISSTIGPNILAAGIKINPEAGTFSRKAAGGVVPEKDKLIERIGAYAGGYTPGKIKSMSLKGFGDVVYNDSEKVVNFPGMKQPAIIPPENSRAGKKYNQAFQSRHGFSPYNEGFVPNFADLDIFRGLSLSKEFSPNYKLKHNSPEFLQSLLRPNIQLTSQSFFKKNQLDSADGILKYLLDSRLGGTAGGVTPFTTDLDAAKEFSGFLTYKRQPFLLRSSINSSNVINSKNDLQSLLNNHKNNPLGIFSSGGKYSVHHDLLMDYLKKNPQEYTFKDELNLANYIQREKEIPLLGNSFNGELYNKGFVPNFSPISSAIQRESKSVPKSLIRVGQNPVLRSDFNPTGLGVYNLRDEPNGLHQGVNRAFAEGMNPKSYGIPNFVAPSKYIRGNYDIVGGSTMPSGMGNQIQSDIRDSLRKLFKQFEDGAISARGMTRQLENVQKQFSLTDDALLRVKSNFSKFKKEVILDQNFNQAITNSNPRNASGHFIGNQSVFGNIRQQYASARGGAINYRNAELDYVNSSYKKPFGYEGLFNPAINSDKLKYAKRFQEITQKISTTSSFDLIGLAGQSKLFKEIEKIKRNYSDLVDDSEVSRLKGIRKEKIGNAALGGSFILPMISETIRASMPQTEEGRKTGAAIGAASGVGSLALTGLALGGGPWGAAIGGAIGVFTELPKVIDEYSSSVPELTKQLERIQEQTNLTAQSLNSYISASEKLSQIYSGALTGVTNYQIKNLQQEQSKNLAQIPIGKRDKIRSLIETGQISEARDEESKINKQNAQKQNLFEQKVKLETLFKPKTSLLKMGKDNSSLFPLVKILSELSGPGLMSNIKQTFKGRDLNLNPSNLMGFATDLEGNTMDRIQKIASGSLTTQEAIKQRQTGNDIYKTSLPLLTGMENSSGKNILSLLGDNPEALNRISSAKGKTQLDFLGNFAEEKGLAGFRDVLKDISEYAEEHGIAALEGLQNQFSKLLKPDEINKNIRSMELYESNQKRQAIIFRDMSMSYSQFIDSIAIQKEKFNSEIDIKDLKSESMIQRQQNRRTSNNKISELTSGDYGMAQLNFEENLNQSSDQKRFGLKKMASDYQKSINEAIINNYVETVSSLREEILRNSSLSDQIKPAKIQSVLSNLKNIFQDSGVDFKGSIPTPDLTNLSRIKSSLQAQITSINGSDSIYSEGSPEALNSNSKNEQKLTQSEKNIYTKKLQDVISAITAAENQRLTAETKIIENYKLSTVAIQEEFESRKLLIGAENADYVIRSKLNSENERKISILSGRGELDLLKFNNSTENKSFTMGGFEKTAFQSDRALSEISLQEQNNLRVNIANALKDLKASKSGLQFQGIENKGALENRIASLKSIKDPLSFGQLVEAEKTLLKINDIEKQISITESQRVEKQKELNAQILIEAKRRLAFSDSLAEDNLRTIQNKIADNPKYKLSGKDISSTVRNELRYNNADIQRDTIQGVSDVTRTMKQSFAGAMASIIKDGKDVGEAFKDVLISVLNKITDRVTQMSTDILFNGLMSAGKSIIGANSGGLIRGYSTGGQVTGGSGMKDDVPAMLSAGEYVIKRDSVKKIGIENLEKLNSGDEKSALLNLRNQFAYDNEKKPTKGNFDTNGNLSSFALTDTDTIRTNIEKFDREGKFYDYLAQKRDYELQKKNAMIQFNNQKRNRRYGAYMSAAMSIGGAGLSSWASGIKQSGGGVSGGVDASGFQTTGMYTAATGGLIQRFASGGHVFGGNTPTDNIPALLTGGEYVIKKDRVKKIGIRNLDALNHGNVPKFAEGGLVGRQEAGVTSNNEIFNALTSSINKLTETLNTQFSSKSNQTSTTNSTNGVNNYINVSINIDAKNNVTSSTNSKTESNGSGKNRNEDSDRQNNEKLGRQLEAKMKEVVLGEIKQGGSIFTFVNSSK